jgi:hypothetical protein
MNSVRRTAALLALSLLLLLLSSVTVTAQETCNGFIYTVRPGDNCFEIARANGVELSEVGSTLCSVVSKLKGLMARWMTAGKRKPTGNLRHPPPGGLGLRSYRGDHDDGIHDDGNRIVDGYGDDNCHGYFHLITNSNTPC